MTELEKIKKMTGESDEELLSLLLADATEEVLLYTRRKHVIPEFQKVIRELTIIAYNRLGAEGETARRQGEVSSSFDVEQQKIYNQLKPYRLCKCGGKTFETAKSEGVYTQTEDTNNG